MVIFYSTCYPPSLAVFFFFNDTATTEIYTLSLHDALPISCWALATTNSVTEEPRKAAARVIIFFCSGVTRASKRSSFRERSEEHTSELQSQSNLVCRLLLEKKKLKQLVTHRTIVYLQRRRC